MINHCFPLKTFVGFLILLAGLSSGGCSHAKRSPDFAGEAAPPAAQMGSDLLTYCREMNSCETEIFKWISRIDRSSYEEKTLHEGLVRTFQSAKEALWNNSALLSQESDVAGNLVMRLSGTGRYSGTAEKTIALQAHTDSGIGIALALRYLLDPSREHPPLELVFTPDEESGRSGGRELSIPLHATEMINLDSAGSVEEKGSAVLGYGSLGTGRWEMEGEMAAKSFPAGMEMRQLSFSLTGLKGGHSGLDIHLPRANAVKSLAWILERFLNKVPQTFLVSAVAGSSALNQIPSSFKAVIAIPKSVSTPEASQILNALAGQHILLYREEKGTSIHFTVNEVEPIATLGLSPDRIRALTGAIGRAPNGVLAKSEKFPNHVKTSSNLSYFEATAAGEGQKVAQMKFETSSRSYFTKDLARISEHMERVLRSVWSPGESVHVKGQDRGVAPRLDLVLFGPAVRNTHTSNEKWEVERIRRTSAALGQLLAAGG